MLSGQDRLGLESLPGANNANQRLDVTAKTAPCIAPNQASSCLIAYSPSFAAAMPSQSQRLLALALVFTQWTTARTLRSEA